MVKGGNEGMGKAKVNRPFLQRAKLYEKLQIDIAGLGYFSPGHGLKGKLNPLTGDEDLEDMYGEQA